MWLAYGSGYADTMTACAAQLASCLQQRGVPIRQAGGQATLSHAFAVDARQTGGGSNTALHLRKANLLTSAIGLPSGLDDGLRIGTNELVRWGATVDNMDPLAELIARALRSDNPSSIAPEVTAYRSQFTTVHYTR